MKNFIQIISFLVIMGTSMTPAILFAAENITSFISDISIYEDGTFQVTETITYDFDDEQRHGIFRTIPLSHIQKASVWYKKRYIDIVLDDVLLDGESVPYDTKKTTNTLTIKIGDPEKTRTGIHTYVLQYTVEGGLTYTDTDKKYTDLYWNVTGNQWPVNMQKVITIVRAPAGALRSNRTCYTGVPGKALPCTAIEADSNKVTFVVENLAQGEDVTIAQSFNVDKIALNVIEKIPPYLSIFPILFVFIGFVFYTAFRFRTKHNPHDTIVPQYEPYPGVLPMYTGVVVDGKLDPKDITAGILYLAQQGFIKIKRTDKKTFFLFEGDEYHLTLLRSLDETPTLFHKQILSLLFSKKEVGETISLDDLKKDTIKQKSNYQTVQSLKRAIQQDLVQQGFYEKKFNLSTQKIIAVCMVLFFIWIGIYNTLGKTGVLFLLLGVCAVGIIYAVIVHKRRTEKGYHVRNHIKGFQNYLSVTETERFAFHNAPEKNPEQYMKYLPYAIALGVEKQWAKVFKDIPIQNPSWYENSTNGVFSATDFARDVGSFSDSLAGSSGSSPSSGGGVSGGGVGGGGGGSW